MSLNYIIKPTSFISLPILIILGIIYVVIIGMVALTSQVPSLFTALVCLLYPLAIICYKLVYASNSIQISERQITVIDFLPKWLIKIKAVQEISFDDIEWVYFLEREAGFLKLLRDKFIKHRISTNEYNYKAENLMHKYNIKDREFESFTNHYLKSHDASWPNEIYPLLELLYDKYDIPGKVKREISKGLKSNEYYNYNFLYEQLRGYPISKEEFIELEDEFAQLGKDIFTQYCATKLNVNLYASFERWPADRIFSTKKIDLTLVISNTDGLKKIYIRDFQFLKMEDKSKFLNLLRQRKPTIKFLISKHDMKILQN